MLPTRASGAPGSFPVSGSSWDPTTFTVVASILGLTSLAAAWIPANKASRADPMAALRAE
jgi:ABC-type lipoprotein release transport system permease subunit